jgi:DNA-binding SARP family transcriptional activator
MGGTKLLRIALFGRILIKNEEVCEQTKLTHTAQSLLVYLLLFRNRIHTRDSIANLFWGDYPQQRARNCLNTALWRLRRFLEPDGVLPGTYLISTSVGELGFNVQSNYWLDVDIFEHQIAKLLSVAPEQAGPDSVSLLEQVIRLYNGDLLEGYYCDWALRERERLRCCYVDCLYYLMRYYSKSADISKALTYGQEILKTDPIREDVHRQMMGLYMQSGQRSLAVRQYNACVESLRVELGISPMPETQALISQITESGKGMLSSAGAPPPSEIHQAIEELHSAVEKMNLADQKLKHILAKFHNSSLP